MRPAPIIPASYWVTEALAAGQYPGAHDPADASARLARFARAGVTTFVDLTHPWDGLEPYAHLLDGGRRHSFPIRDLGVPTVGEMTAILDAVDEELAAGETVYVHCWGGYGRTGTVVGCWLVRHGAAYEEAIALIDERRRPLPVYRLHPESPQTPAQHAFVRVWSPGA